LEFFFAKGSLVLEKYQMFNRINLLTGIGFLAITQSCLAHSAAHETHAFSQNPEVKSYINMMVKENHFKQSYLEMIFNHVKVKQKPKVIISIKRPLEEMTWDRYRSLYVSPHHIERGKEFMHEYSAVLARAEKTYGVPAGIIVATIGIESNYGKNIGKFRVIDTLANLAFSSGRRKKFFKKELTDFLILSRDQHLNPLTMMGSYTGAIGLPQFMPSSYRYYAVNFSGDRSVDLAYNVPDAIASIANYYQKNGWHSHQVIAFPAKNRQPYSGWFSRNNTAYKFVQCGWIPDDPDLLNNTSHCVILRTRSGRERWIGYHNFTVIKRYNHSELYAMAVFQLGYNIIQSG